MAFRRGEKTARGHGPGAHATDVVAGLVTDLGAAPFVAMVAAYLSSSAMPMPERSGEAGRPGFT